MNEITIDSKKIVSLGEDFSEYELPSVKALDFDLFVYKYRSGPYDGSGFAAWRKGDKYFYHELGHCSCNGPTDGIGNSKNMGISLVELKRLEDKYNEEYMKPVIEYLESHV